MKKICVSFAILGILLLPGCAFIIGKHPGVNAMASHVYCFPCIDIEGKGGGGLAWVRNRPVLGYRYSDLKSEK